MAGRKPLSLLFASLLFLGACSSQFGSSYFAPTAALVCGGISCAKIPESAIAEQLTGVMRDPEASKPFHGPGAAANRVDAQRQILGNLIKDEVTLQRARKDLAITEASVQKEADDQFRQLRSQFPSKKAWEDQLEHDGISEGALKRLILTDSIIRKVQERVGKDAKATAQEVEQFYQLNKSQYDEQVNISHILICGDFNVAERKCNGPTADDQARAQQALTRARAGEDFGALAKEYSVDDATKNNNGEVGFVSRGDLVPELESVAFSLAKVGDISDPVKTQFGLHIVKLNAIGKPLEAARKDIEEGLTQRKQTRAYDEWLIAAIKDADIRVNAKIGKYDTIAQQVVPVDSKPEEEPAAAGPSPTPASTAAPEVPSDGEEPAVPEEPVQPDADASVAPADDAGAPVP